MSYQTSSLENLLIGTCAGSFEIFCEMPLITMRWCSQEGRAFPKEIMSFWRGAFVESASVGPLIGIQMAIDGALGYLITGHKRTMTDYEQIGSALTSGAISGLLYGPVDLLAIQQQKMHLSLLTTGREIVRSHGFLKLFRGFIPCSIREGLYIGGGFGFAPVLKRRIRKMGDFSEVQARFWGSAATAVGSTVLSHPIDTVKTNIQADLEAKQFKNIAHATKKLYKTGGLKCFCLGAQYRTIGALWAYFVFDSARVAYIDYMSEEPSQFKFKTI